MKTVPENWCKSNKNDQREYEIIQKLTDERGDVRLHTIRKFAVGIFMKRFTDCPIQKVIDEGRRQKSDGTAEQNEPRSAENPVKRAVIVCIGGDDACDEKDHASQ